MSRFRTLFFLVVFVLVLMGVLLAQSANVTVQAEPVLTPTLVANAWSYLPIVRKLGQAPPATATVPGPTQTASPTLTSTLTNTPFPTNTPQPGRLASPTLFDIHNDDHDGNFTIGWSTVPDAEYYRLEQKRNDNNWKQIYEGPQREFARVGLSDGQYCYRVMALNVNMDSEWSAVKCSTVTSATSTPTVTNTPRPGELVAPVISDIDNADGDGRFAVVWSSVPGAEWYKVKENHNNTTWEPIHEGPATSINRTNLPNGQYCYRVRAFNSGTYSEWSTDKCSYVESIASTPTATSTPTIIHTPEPFHCDFVFTDDMSNPRYGGEVTKLDSGNILFTGGLTNPWGNPNKFEVFDPETNRFNVVSNVRLYPNHTATKLHDGSVLIINVNPGCGKSALLFTEYGGGEYYQMSGTDDLNISRNNHTATLLDNGDVIVIGGDCDTESPDTFEIYDHQEKKFHLAGTLSRVSFSSEQTLASHKLWDGRIVHVAHRSRDGTTSTTIHFFVYDPEEEKMTEYTSRFVDLWGISTSLINGGGSGLLVTGYGSSGKVEAARFRTSTWRLVASDLGPGLVAHKEHTVLQFEPEKTLILGGINEDLVEYYDAPVEEIKYAGIAPEPIWLKESIKLDDGRILLAGGLESSDPTSGSKSAIIGQCE